MMLANAAPLPLMTGAAWLLIHAARQPKLMQTVRRAWWRSLSDRVMTEVLRQAETVPRTIRDRRGIIALLPDALLAMADELQEK